MVKKKQKSKKKPFFNSITVSVVALLLLSTILIGVIYLSKRTQKEDIVQQPASGSESSRNSLNNPAVAEAKAVADEYFEAVKNCDLEKANSLLLLPKNTSKTTEECQSECPGGLRYKFLKPVSYNSKESGGVAYEVAAFDYLASCSDKTTPLLIQIIRSSDDNKWQVLSKLM